VFAWTVLSLCALLVAGSFAFVDQPWVFRATFYSGFVVGALVFLRGNGIRFREVGILLVVSVGAFVVFRYFTDRPIQVIGEAIAFALPLLVGAGIGRWFVLGTLAPGNYSGYSAADTRLITAFEGGLARIVKATEADNERLFLDRLQRARGPVNVETTDPAWQDVRNRYAAVLNYLIDNSHRLGDEVSAERVEAEKLRDSFLDAFERIALERRVWFGRFGSPTTRAA
jgi:hypothetical protein